MYSDMLESIVGIHNRFIIYCKLPYDTIEVYWISEQTCTDAVRISLAYWGWLMLKKNWNIYRLKFRSAMQSKDSCRGVFVGTKTESVRPLLLVSKGLFTALTRSPFNRAQVLCPGWLICNCQNFPCCVTNQKTRPVSRSWDVSSFFLKKDIVYTNLTNRQTTKTLHTVTCWCL